MAYTVYALFDVREPEAVRYIGLSKNPAGRLLCHIQEARIRQRRTHKTNWLNKIVAEGAQVDWRALGRYETAVDAANAERAFIQDYLERGCRLVNETAGGENIWGIDLTPEARERFRAILRSPEYRAKASAALRGRPKTAEHKINSGAGNRGKVRTPEMRAKISATKTGHVVIPPEMRARISAKLKGRSKSAETRKRMQEAQRRRFAMAAHAD